jgi:hypothetical protein
MTLTPRISVVTHVFSLIFHAKTAKCLSGYLRSKTFSHFFLQLVSQDSAQELFRLTTSPYLGVSRIEFQLCCLWIRFVSQGVVCFHSVGFGGSWTFPVIFLNVSRGSTLFKLFLCIHHLPRRHMMSFFTVLSVFVLIILSRVTFLYPRSLSFFIQLQINTHKKKSTELAATPYCWRFFLSHSHNIHTPTLPTPIHMIIVSIHTY